MGDIQDGNVVLSEIGKIVERTWLSLPEHFLTVILDSHIVMPNHFHGIIIIDDDRRGEVTSPFYEDNSRGGILPFQADGLGGGTPPLRKRPTLGQIIAYFKYKSTKESNQLKNLEPGPFWQHNYYEHIIRHQDEYYEIRKYVLENPIKWDLDEENPSNI